VSGGQGGVDRFVSEVRAGAVIDSGGTVGESGLVVAPKEGMGTIHAGRYCLPPEFPSDSYRSQQGRAFPGAGS